MVWHRRHPAPGNNISLDGEIKLQKTKHYSPRHGESQMQEWPVQILSNNTSSHEIAFCKHKTQKETVLFNACLWGWRVPTIPPLTQRDSQTRFSQTSPCLTCPLPPPSSVGSGQRWLFNFMFCIELDHTKLHLLFVKKGRQGAGFIWSTVEVLGDWHMEVVEKEFDSEQSHRWYQNCVPSTTKTFG